MKTNTLKIIAGIIFVYFAFQTKVQSQNQTGDLTEAESSTFRLHAVNLRLFQSTLFSNDKYYPGLGLKTEFLWNEQLLALEYNRLDEFDLFCSSYNSINQVNLMVGKQYGDERFIVYGQAGLGVVWGLKRGDIVPDSSAGWLTLCREYEKEKYSTLGVPIELGVRYHVLPFMSLGLGAGVNLNPENSGASIHFSIGFGKFR
ncbi:MAG: hypothetical protein EA361_10225 [Bacteroidetes bacterium]|nr:MAG: hypothetical protein EA361_10225 [Bacteroidota bacterium]